MSNSQTVTELGTKRNAYTIWKSLYSTSLINGFFKSLTSYLTSCCILHREKILQFLTLQITELTCTVDICTGGALVGVAGRGVIVFWGWDWACACACICAKACWGIISNCPFSLRTRTMPVKKEISQETYTLFKYERTYFFRFFYPSCILLMYCWRTTELTKVV